MRDFIGVHGDPSASLTVNELSTLLWKLQDVFQAGRGGCWTGVIPDQTGGVPLVLEKSKGVWRI
jgi:hypothetical protein